MRLTPRASADAIDGPVADASGAVRLKARVRAIAENNKANRAIEALIAKRLGVAKSNVRVISGETARSKTIRVAGDPEALAAAVAALPLKD